MRVKIVSFGKKYTNINTSEFNSYYDVRFLKNPFWDPTLKHLSGLDKEVKDYIFSDQASRNYAESLLNTLKINLKGWNRSEEYVIGIACTGGRHRSVALAEYLFENLSKDYNCYVEHLTIDYNEENFREKTDDYLPRVVAIGGGTGLSSLLKGLVKFPIDLTAIVTVSDSGGSTRDIRNWFEMPAPGDIRRVLLSMSSKRTLFETLFNFRFSNKNDNLVSKHTVGNIVLAALYELHNGNFSDAVDDLGNVLDIKGRVLPISRESLDICCEYTDGTVIVGEEHIPNKNKKISKIYYKENEPTVNKDAVEAILSADLVILSSGSLYTSLIPNLLFNEVQDALKRTRGQVAFLANVTTQVGETLGYTLEDHVTEVEKYIGNGVIKHIIANNNFIIPNKKAEENFESIEFVKPSKYDSRYVFSDIIKYNYENDNVVITHHSEKAGYLLFRLAYERMFGLDV